jgi:PTS system cellobiose-specific IIB component
MSTSLLVNRIKDAIKEQNVDVEVEAFAVRAVESEGANADVILLGPQVRFELKRLQALYPEKKIASIDMQAYGMMDGKRVLKQALDLFGK